MEVRGKRDGREDGERRMLAMQKSSREKGKTINECENERQNAGG